MVTREIALSKPEMPSSLLLEVPALADFNRAWTELTDWLSLLDRVLKSQRVMVGDLEDINEMIMKQKVRLKRIKVRRDLSLECTFSTGQFSVPGNSQPDFRQLLSVRKMHYSPYSVQV